MKKNMAGILRGIAGLYMVLVLLGGIILAYNADEGTIFFASIIMACFGFFMMGFAQLIDDTRAIREKVAGGEAVSVDEMDVPTL